jgi:membrane protein YdbS with pleckstrin-like domain
MLSNVTGAVESAPHEQLDPHVRTAWRLTALASGAIELGAALATAFVLTRIGVEVQIAAVPVVLTLVWVAIRVAVLPGLHYARWRYDLREEEIDLQHGIITITRTLIPMTRVQHVDTRRGPFDRWLGLASVVVHTAAGASTIPGLAVDTAGELRERIAALANTRDES